MSHSKNNNNNNTTTTKQELSIIEMEQNKQGGYIYTHIKIETNNTGLKS